MKRTLLVSFALVLACAEVAQAQIIQPMRRTTPRAWTSLAAGWSWRDAICDPDSSACWNFGGALQYRASLEIPMARDVTVGIVGTTSRVPLLWSGTGPAPNQCTLTLCDGDVNISQILGNLRLGGGSGSGLHQVIDVIAGTTMFSNFRTTDGAKLGPGKTVNDVTIGLGVGAGYSLNSRAQIVITQEWAIVLHKRQPGSPNNSSRQSTIRVGGRFGLGTK